MSTIEKSRVSTALRLDNQLCFSLYSASHRVLGLFRPLLADLGLTYTQYLILLVLWERDRRLVREFGAALQLDSGTLSPVLKRLEAARLVHRRRRLSDEREMEVTLTPAGLALQEPVLAVRQTVVEQIGMDDRQMLRLQRALDMLSAHILDDPADAQWSRRSATPASSGR